MAGDYRRLVVFVAVVFAALLLTAFAFVRGF
jgi:hypothetical protein